MKPPFALAIAAILGLAGCATSAIGTRNLAEAVATQGGAPGAQYRQAMTDLNGDGIEDAVVLVESGEACAGQGCPLLVFRGSRDGYFLVSRTTPVKRPVAVATTRTNGWSDLIVETQGVGKVVLVFETYGYTANAAMAVTPSSGQVSQARPVLE